MLRFLFCLIVILPIFFISKITGNQDAVAEIEIEKNTYQTFTDTKISTLRRCEAENIPVYFSDRFVESHSAAFLHAAVEAAANCSEAKAHVVNLKFEDMNDSDEVIAAGQVKEVTEFLKAYDTNVEIDRVTRVAKLDTRAVNGRAVIVEFEFGADDTSRIED